MILIAPDKFKGTLSATEAARIIADVADGDTFVAPMADGGEGTAEILCKGKSGWQFKGDHYFNRSSSEAVIDSSSVIGLSKIDPATHDILAASSYQLGKRVREILESGARKVIIGVGGTNCCDGGMGFVEALGNMADHKECFMGLIDVAVPLEGAIDFAPQKGATPDQLPILSRRLSDIAHKFPERKSRYDGAGGGLGFALASIIGAECRDGAEYVLDSYGINWDEIDLAITGEGRIDSQTTKGKVVDTVMKAAAQHGVKCIGIGGTVAKEMQGGPYISSDIFLADRGLDVEVARERLRLAATYLFTTLKQR